MKTPKPETCSRLRQRFESGSSRAYSDAQRAGCDWTEQFERPARPCRTVPRSFTTKTGKTVEFLSRVGDCGPRAAAEKRALAASCFSVGARGVGVPAADCGPAAPAGCETDRSKTRVITPQGDDRASYRLIEAEDLVPSHNPLSFEPDPRYPANVQEREYQNDTNEQIKVAMGAQKLNPGIMLHRSPTAVDGPPLVTEDGCALGGNGRSMMLKRAYLTEPEKADAYRDALRCELGQFGIPQRELEGMRQPVLVRVIAGTRCDDDSTDLAKAVRRYNEGLTNVIDSKALGVSQSRSLSQQSLSMFAQAMQGDTSLREAMAEEPELFLRALENDRILTRQNRTRYVKPSGELTNEGKDVIEAMFLGRVVGNADRIRSSSEDLLKRVERAVPYLTAVAGQNPDYDLTETTQKAIDLANSARSKGQTIDAYVSQLDFLSARPDSRTTALARLLTNERPLAIRDRFKDWATKAAFDPSQGGLLGKPPSPEEAFETLTAAVARKGRALFTGTVVKQPEGLARIVIKGDSKPVSEGGTGIKVGQAVIEYMTGPLRGQRAEFQQDTLGDVAG